MNKRKNKRLFLIKAPYWVGIAADTLWTVALLWPRLFGVVTGRPGFAPDLDERLVMGIGASLMAGWTFLLVWAVRAPIERRAVSLLTAFPVVTGLFLVSLVGFLHGSTSNIWLMAKTLVLFVAMVGSFVLAQQEAGRM